MGRRSYRAVQIRPVPRVIRRRRAIRSAGRRLRDEKSHKRHCIAGDSVAFTVDSRTIPQRYRVSRWYDISVLLKEGVATWPGDPPFRYRRFATIGPDAANVAAFFMSAHCGTHVDPPF